MSLMNLWIPVVLSLMAVIVPSVANATDGDVDVNDAIENALNDPSVNDSELEYWKSALSDKGDGIYSHNGILYVVVSERFNKFRASTLQNAVKAANRKTLKRLKDWCQAEARKKYLEPKPASESERIVWALLDKMSPGWKYLEWEFSGDARTVFKDQNFESQTLLVVTTLKEIDARESVKKLKARCSFADVVSCIARLFSTRQSVDELQEVCDCLEISDLKDRSVASSDILTEYAKIKKNIEGYITSSPLSIKCYEEIKSLSTPIIETNKVEQTNEYGTETVITEVIKTTIRHPRMQQLFLAYGAATNSSLPRTALGLKAEKIAYDRSVQMSEKLDILKKSLCENPGDVVLWNLYGRCLYDSGDKMGAIICLRNALKIDMKYEYALVNLARVYNTIGCKNLAIRLAFFARGIAKEKWTIQESEKILFGEGK